MDDAVAQQKKLIDALAVSLNAQKMHGQHVRLFETHISWVLVAGRFAYKFKKALHFDFLDFSTLESRRFYCNEELRLNRRLASNIYLSVVTIGGDREQPVIEGAGQPLEYAVKMQAFAQEALWNYRVAHGLTSPAQITAIATRLAAFHQDAAIAPQSSPWGTPQTIEKVADENLAALPALLDAEGDRQQLIDMQTWESRQRAALERIFVMRKSAGMIRECHGDLHCGNVLTIGNRVDAFDCIEFNDSLRWIDVMNDLAFLCMDLAARGRSDLSAALLNQYLEISGDYQGLEVLRYYAVHRALVRAKVTLLLASQQQDADTAQARNAYRRQGMAYFAFAWKKMQPTKAALMIVHGCSGSGKTHFSRCVVELMAAVQLRSDVERKRMHGLPPHAREGPYSGLYDEKETAQTYARTSRARVRMERHR